MADANASNSSLRKGRWAPYGLLSPGVLWLVLFFLVPMGIKVDTLLSLGLTIGILAAGILFSLWKTSRDTPKETLAN